jgi:transposase
VKQLMFKGGQVAVRADEDVVTASRVHRLEQCLRVLERLFGRKTLGIPTARTAYPG